MLRIRLQRRGRRKRPLHHIVVADSRKPRDGRIIEDLGRFDNITPKNQLILNRDRAIHWLKQGAQPTDTVRSIFKKQGIMYEMHLLRWGKTEEEIEAALTEWREAREAKEEDVPTRKERQKALLDAEEKEYQKQLKKKAEEAAKEKAKQEALSSDDDEEEADADEAKAEADEEGTPSQEASETEVAEETEAAPETDTQEEEETAEAEVQEDAADEADEAEAQDETPEGSPAPEATETEEDKEPEAEDAPEETEEDKAEEVEAKEEDTEEAEETTEAEAKVEAPEEEESPAPKASETKDAEADGQTSSDMLAKEAIAHIENTPLEDLKGFVTDDEDRVTVQRAWKSKQGE